MTNGSMVAKDIRAVKKKPSTFNRDKNKDDLRISLKLARPHPLEAQECKSINISFEKRAWAFLLEKSHQKIGFAGFILLCSVIQVCKSRWCHWPDYCWSWQQILASSTEYCCSGMQNVKVMGPWKLPHKFQRTALEVRQGVLRGQFMKL